MPLEKDTTSEFIRRAVWRIVATYAAIALLWIYLSGYLLLSYTQDPQQLVTLEIYKGWLFVLVTTALLFFLVRSAFGKIRSQEANLRESEQRYRYLFEKNPNPMWVIDRESLRYLAVNNAAVSHYGYSREEFLSMTLRDIRPAEDVPALLATMARTPENNIEKVGVWRHRKKDGTIIQAEITSHPLRFEGYRAEMVLAHDITERLRIEDELRRVNRTLRVLSLCNEALVRAKKEEDLLQEVCRNLTEVGGFPLVWVGFPAQDGCSAIHPVAHAGEDAGYLQRLHIPTGSGDCVSNACLERQPFPVILGDSGCPHCRDMAVLLNLQRAVFIPLLVDDEHLGCLVIYSREEAFSPEETGLLNELADDLAYGIASLRNAAARSKAEAALVLRNRALEASSNGVMICAADHDTPILYVNPAFERITGYTAEEVIGRDPRFLSGTDKNQKAVIDIRESLRLGHVSEVEIRNYRKDGSLFWNELSVAPVKDSQDRITHFVGILNDITERKQYEEQLEHQATHDTLTGLANRNLLTDRLAQSLVYADRSLRLVAVLLFDLDRFKVINDSLGHSLGDELLRLVAERLAGCVRAGDTVARLGGDEFVITLVEVAEADDVVMIAKKIRQVLARPLALAGRELHITTSIGISLYPRDGQDSEALIRAADIAMYQAKTEGGDSFHFFAPEMNQRVMETLNIEADLRLALERQEFILHFQPKVDLASGRISGCEALVRWQHPDKGMIPPGAFIAIAEETGLIVPLGAWVLREVCARARHWQQQGLPTIVVSANLSARQFHQSGVVETVRQALSETGLAPEFLELELTESMIMRNPEQAAETMRQLKGLGVHLALDDFGTGYSSLNYLRRFPVDNLKIDRTFISDVAIDASSAAVATSVVAIAHSLGLNAIAEGVETDEQLEFLRNCRCDAFQGYFFSKPLPPEEFADLLREGRKL